MDGLTANANKAVTGSPDQRRERSLGSSACSAVEPGGNLYHSKARYAATPAAKPTATIVRRLHRDLEDASGSSSAAMTGRTKMPRGCLQLNARPSNRPAAMAATRGRSGRRPSATATARTTAAVPRMSSKVLVP